MAIFIGQVISHYAINEVQTENSLLAIYKARDLRTDQKVLLWALFPKDHVSDTFLSGFLELGPKICQLSHPNLLQILDWGEVNGQAFWITQEISGRLLSDCLDNQWTESQAVDICIQACEGLKVLHSNDLLHAVLSPETIILTADKQILLFEYGVAQIVNAEIRRLVPEKLLGYGIGNPSFLSPEIIAGLEPSRAADQYALGALLFTLLTGTEPFTSSNPGEVAIEQIVSPLRWPPGAAHLYSPTTVKFVLKCMAKHPNQRFNNMEDAQNILRRMAIKKRASISLTREQRQGIPRRKISPIWMALVIIPLLITALFFVDKPFQEQVLSFAGLQPTIQATMVSTVSPSATITAADRVTRAASLTPTPPAEKTAVQKANSATVVEPTPEPTVPIDPPEKSPALMGEVPPRIGDEITLQNIGQLREQTRLGYGRLNHADYDYSNEGSLLAIAASSGVYLYQSNQFLKFLDTQDEATSVQFSLDGKVLAIGLKKGAIQLWDMATFTKTNHLVAHSAAVSRIIFSPNGRQFITASYDQYICIWNLSTLEVDTRIHAHSKPIQDIAITNDALQVVSASLDDVVMLWNIDGSKQREFRHSGSILSVAISPDGDYVAAGSAKGMLKQWKTIDGSERSNSLNIGRPIYSLYYFNDDKRLIVGLDGGLQLNLDANYQKDRFGNILGFSRPPALSPNPFDELGADFEFSTFMPDQEITNPLFFSWNGIKGKSGIALPGMGYNKFTILHFSPDSTKLAIGGKLSGATIWDVKKNRSATMEGARIPPGNPFSSSSDRISLIKKQIIQAKNPSEKDRYVDRVDLYNVNNLDKANVLGEYKQNGTVQFVLQDKLLIVTSARVSTYWDLASNYETRLKEGNDHGCQVTRSANDGTFFTALSPLGILTEWDDTSINICKISDRFENRLTALSPDRQWIILVNSNRQLEKISTSDSKSLWRIQPPKPFATIALSPNGSLLVAGAEDGTLSFLDPQTGAIKNEITAHFGPILSVTFSPDGKMLASGSADGTVRIWTTADLP